ncbi:MAG: DUF2635 domain-containing protein [Gammaproteobacteria bacterium]|nr:DUF2635 domain-containing protein [Gammaproteobacteria bacterium]
MFIKPKEGLRVIDPEQGDALPVEGREVEKTSYWIRRLNDGDVIESDAPVKTKKTTRKQEES